jgi:hypothetical protein
VSARIISAKQRSWILRRLINSSRQIPDALVDTDVVIGDENGANSAPLSALSGLVFLASTPLICSRRKKHESFDHFEFMGGGWCV